VRARPLEQEVQVEGDARQVAEILEDREQREEDRHRRQHDADHPRQATVDAVPDEPGEPPRSAETLERARRRVLEPEEQRRQHLRGHVGADDG
jgi:hypothetical protein